MEIPTASSNRDVAVGILYLVRKILGIFTCIKRIKNNMPVLLKNRSKAIYKAEKGRIIQKIAIIGVWCSDYHKYHLLTFRMEMILALGCDIVRDLPLLDTVKSM